jgi:transposase
VIGATTIEDVHVTRARVIELEAALVVERELRVELERKHDRLLGAYQALEQQLELIRRRLYVAKAERIDTTQLELEFAETLAALDALAGQSSPVAPGAGPSPTAPGAGPSPAGEKRRKQPPPTGRRDLCELDLPEERIEITDPTHEGRAPRLDTEESSRLMWRRAGYVRVVTARFKYLPPRPVAEEPSATPSTDDAPAPAAGELQAAEGVSEPTAIVPVDSPMPRVVTAPLPPEMIERSFGTPSLWAHVVTDKLCWGLPLYRQEERFEHAGFRIDRGTLSRWMQELGLTVGATVVHAMREEALRTAFCIATDATGVLVQPIRGGDKQRRACQRGHYFVQIADADHVFFEYTPKETSAAVGELFRGFSGYVQADAKSVYDFLYRPPDQRRLPDDGEPDLAVRREVACWSHLRTKWWEAAIVTKDVVAREGLARLARIFALDRSWKDRPHPEVKALREQHLRPHVDAFFAFVDEHYERLRDQRGLLRTALGYAHRQHAALTRFFEDGRLKLTNNGSERELRRVATGRKAWLFVGSDDHAQAAGNLLTLIASARLHKLDPEAYLCDLFRVLPQWPRDRYIELAPKYWPATRARMDQAQLAVEIGWLTIPPPPAQ